MAQKNPQGGLSIRPKKWLGLKSSLRTWTILALALFMVFAIGVSALQNPGQGEQTGARNAKVKPKRAPAGRDRNTRAGKSKSAALSMSSLLSPVLATADFDLLGLAVTADPSSLTVPKNTATSIHTSVRVAEGTDPFSIITALNPNYRVRGELTGPSLTAPLTLEAPIGQPLNIPPLSNAGDHLIRNLRVVDLSTPEQAVVTSVTPDSCGIVVIERLLVSQVQVQQLTYDQIIQAGINITGDSYRAFNFTLGIATTSTAQTISIPVAFPPVGVTDPRPLIGTPSVSAPGIDVPSVYPIMLQAEGPDGEPQGLPQLPGEEPVKIPGVIVFPGRVGFLHQFFEAIVIVSNGAPNGAPLVLHSLRAKAILPDGGTPANTADDPLRIAETQVGGRVSELDLHGLGADNRYGTGDDTTSFGPGQAGQGSFLFEGLKEGLHTVNFDLEAMLEGLPSGPIKVRGEVTGAVLVRDASFAATFTHPNVVRAGNEYDLGMTVHNSGQTDIQGAFAQLPPTSISGASFVGQDTGQRQFANTIKRGESATVKWRLRANVTGEVTATYVKVGEGISAGLALVTGVGDRNIPLSPDSLILPEPVKHLPPNTVEAARAVLGQAWSIANAPSGSLPPGIASVSKQTVVDRAVELGIAGMRVDFGEPVTVSLDTVLRDWLGELQAFPDTGFADTQRNTRSGYEWFDSVGAELYQHLNGSSPVTPLALHQEFANTELPRSRFISALVTHANGPAIVGTRFVDAQGKKAGFGVTPDERAGDLMQGSSLRLSHTDVISGAITNAGQMLVISNPVADNWTLELNGWQAGAADLSLVAPTNNQAYNLYSWTGIQITQSGKYRVRFKPLSLSSVPVLEEFRDGSWQAATATAAVTPLTQPAPRVVGVIQVTPDVVAGGDKYGRLVGILFSKPMLQDQAQAISRYRIGGGVLKGSNPAQQVGDQIGVTGARIDYGNRFVFLSLNATIGPYIERDLTISSMLDTRRLPLSPSPVTTVIQPRVSPEGVPPGAYLTGRVINADGTPVPNAPVIYWVQECPDPSKLLPEEPKPIVLKFTDAQGRYAIDYVRDSDCSPLSVSVNNPTTHSEKRLTSPVAYDGQHMVLDMVFLARGNVEGNITSNGQPMPRAFVQIVPQLDVIGTQVVQADQNGHYVATDIPVGNISVLAVGEGAFRNASGFNAGTISGPGQTAVINVSLQNIAGAVRGRVFRADQNAAPGSLVVAYAVIPGFPSFRNDRATAVGYAFADRDGSFTIANLPIGDIKLEVTDYVTGLFAQQNVQLSNAIPEVSGLVIVLPGSGAVSGRVTDDVGAPLSNVFVSSAGRAVQTDSSGNYTLQSLPAGPHSISAFDSVSQRVGSAQAQVTIGQTTTGIDIVILRPSTVQGTVYVVKEGTSTPVPAAGASVSVDGFTIVSANAQGQYTIPNVPPGDYLLRLVDATKGYTVNTPVKLLPGETLTRDATFRSGTIHGKVFQPDGVTPTIAQLTVYIPHPDLTRGSGWGILSTEPPFSTQSAVDGSYSLTGLNPGTYRITTSNVFFPTRVSVGGTLPPSGNEEANLTLVSTLAGKIQGNVFRPDGTTSVGPGIKVTLSGGSLADASVHTDENGHYEFGEVFSAGSYRLTATDPASGQTNQINVAVERNKDAMFNLQLLGLGNLRVQVVDGAGQPAAGGSLTIDGTEYPNAHRFANVPVGSNGQITFDNLPEGSYAVAATRFGLGGRVSARVTVNSTVDVTVQLQATGNVEGHVYLPDGTTAISLADVQLRVGGRSVGYTVTSEGPDVGKFTFVNVPTGDFTLDAFDNHTGRVGRAAGTVTTQGETLVVNVLLLPIGAVSGQVTANGVGVDHASVRITADGSGVRGANLFATTDPNGNYRFTGIPAGRFVISVADAPGGQTGSASGTISGTVEPLPDTIVNIALEPSQTVRGTVYRNGGTEPVPGAQVTITVAGRVFHTATNDQGLYALAFVPLGTVNVRAEAPVGYDRGEAAPVTGTQPGGTVTVNLTMNGVGIVSGTALDSNGSPLTSGTVVFTNSVWSPAVVINASVQPNGTFEITGVPAGNFSLRLTVPGRVAVGSASGAALAGQTTNVTLQLEDAGTVTGRVHAADGSTPVQGASVSVTLNRPSGTVSFFTHTGAQGIWTLNNVPLGTLDIKVTDEVSGGVARARNVVLATNGQVVDVGTMLLDSTPISVVSVEPANGTLSVPTNGTVVTITFSEPAEASTVHGGTVQLQLNNSAIGTTLSLSSDGRVATLTPNNRLNESAVYKVFVNQVEDRAGLRIANAFTSTFTTADETAPVVTAISPVNSATEVIPGANVVVTFSEPIDSTDNLANIIKVSVSQSTDPLAGTYALSTDSRVATFTPAVALADSTAYTVNVNGQRDAAGNTQTQAFVSSFVTQDRTAPVIDPLPIDGTTVRDFTPTITATYHDNLSGIKTSSVVLTVDNVNVTQSASVTGSQITFTPTASLAAGPHTIAVQVADNAGNVSAFGTASFTIDDSGPDITSFTIGGAPAVDGMFVTSSLQPVFAITYTDDTGINVSATQLLLAPQGSPLVAVPATITQTGLTYTPPAFLAEGQYVVQATITNNLGTSSTTGVINFTLDVDAPEITSVTPATGNQHGGTTVTITGARLLNTNGTAPIVTIGGNSTQVTSAVAGSPNVLTLITPAGAPGPATIRISTDRGTGVVVGGFTYQADPRTPFVTEPDSVLLWHMDEQGNGAVRIVDSGINRSIFGTASGTSLLQPGRFAFGRSDANIVSDSSALIHFGAASFTVECWVKTGVVPRTYTIVGHEDANGGQTFPPSYTVRLSPNGNLRALATDTGSRQWLVDVPATVYKVDDNQWHYIAMVVNRAANRLSLYVDGLERGSSAPPANFGPVISSSQQLRVGQRGFDSATPNGPIAFPGTVDEVRLSSTAHTSDQIQKTYLGTEGPLGITITNSSPLNVARGTTTDVQLNGYNLAGTIASITGAASANITAQVVSSSATQARVQIAVAPDAPVGDGQLVMSSSAGSASLPIRIVELSNIALAVESDTRLLWHMNETANGVTTIFDSGRLRINGSSTNLSASAPGRFDGGRIRAHVATPTGHTDLYFGSSSFTVEGWVKTDPVGRTYNLFGKQDANGGQTGNPEWAVKLLPNGTLRALAFDTGARQWLVDIPATVYRVDDNQWHFVTMVVDRTNNRLSLYVDGVERAFSAPPANFGALLNPGNSFRAGHWSFFETQTTGGAQEFPGVLDEIRVSATAHTAARVLDDMTGSSPLRITSYDPKEVLREKEGLPSTNTQITVNGYNLDGVTARLMRDGQMVDAVVHVDSSTSRQAIVSVDAQATAPLGIAQLVFSKPGQTDVAVDLRISQQTDLSGALDTLLIWNLNETGDGNVRVFDSGALGIHGTADAQSLEQPGRLGRGRSRANLFSDPDKDALYVGSSSFTAELWMKTSPVTRAYSLIAKEDVNGGQTGSPEFTLRLSPTGALRAYAFDTGGRFWRADMAALVYQVDDNQWHHMALVVDRSLQRMFIYVDGVERASSAMPAGFGPLLKTTNPLRAGHWAFFEENSAGGPEEFPGTIDDVRLSNTAHSAERIRADLDGVPGLRINSYGPREIHRSPATGPAEFATLTATGFGLDNVTASVMRDGQLLDATVIVDSSSYNQAQLRVSIAATVTPGLAQLVFVKPGLPVVPVEIRIREKSELATDTDTRLLWHLNETGNGAVRVFDAGPLGIAGTADAQSTAESAGHFGFARSKANIAADPDFDALYLGSSSFTVELWMKTNPVTRAYSLVAKEDVNGGQTGSPEFSLRLSPTGALRAYAFDTGGRFWRADVPGRVYDPATGRWLLMIDDNEWHHVALVMDRSSQRMLIYVDGIERASSVMPSGFGPLLKTTNPFRVGHWAFFEENSAGGPEEFPGLIDEVRISTTAHSAARIFADAVGTDVAHLSSMQPSYVPNGSFSVPVTFTGFGLSGATVTTDQPNVTLTVTSTTPTNINALLDVPAAANIGPLNFTITTTQGQFFTTSLTIVDHQPFSNPANSGTETVVLWHLDETSNGAVHINGSGDPVPTVIGGTAGTVSSSVDGRFGKGRLSANIAGETANNSTNLGSNSFTIECWVKGGPSVTRAYTLVGKEDVNGGQTSSPEYSLRLSPTGGLRAYVFDNGGRLWRADMAGRVFDSASGRYLPTMNDGQWHYIAMVADRTAGRLILYADGVERASGTIPAGFGPMLTTSNPLRVGHWAFFEENSAGGPEAFPGIIDEVRIQNFARTAAQIADAWYGTNSEGGGPNGLSAAQTGSVKSVKNQKLIVNTIAPGLVPRDRTSRQALVTKLALQGANLSGITARVMRDGQPLDSVEARVEDATDSQAHLALAVAPNTPLGPAQLVLSKQDHGDVAVDIRVIEPSEFAVEADTIGLWHLDERDHGMAHLLDAGQNAINLTSARASRPTEGRFGFARTSVRATADANNTALSLGASSFTVEGWLKAPTLGRDYVLIGKETNNGQNTDFTLKALASGALHAEIYDTAGLVWQAETVATTLTDDQWHAFALVVDRETGSLSLYLDGQIQMLVPAPAGFGAVRNLGQPLQLGSFDSDASGNGPDEFPGVLDEIRISSTAHKPDKIAVDFFGNDEPKITFIRPPVVRKGAGPVEVTLSGYGLIGATVLPNQPGVTATVISSTLTSIRISLAVYDFVPAGPASLLFRDVLGRGFSVDINVEERPVANRFGFSSGPPDLPPNRLKPPRGSTFRSRLNQHVKRVGGQR